DYSGVLAANGSFIGVGVVWMGYYRSENGGTSFISSLIPGYPGDSSPFAARAHVRTSGAGDPVLAWDSHGRLFAGSESSGDPDGTAKAFGDVWVGTYKNPNGTGGATVGDGHVYVTYRQFADVRSNSTTDAIAYNASTDCGASFSQPMLVQTFEPYDPTDISVGGGVAGDCGDFASACVSGYTFMRGGTQI